MPYVLYKALAIKQLYNSIKRANTYFVEPLNTYIFLKLMIKF